MKKIVLTKNTKSNYKRLDIKYNTNKRKNV